MTQQQTPAAAASSPRALDPFVCARCRAPLRAGGKDLICSGCGARYPVVNDIPILSALDDDDNLGQQYKRRQIEFFDGEIAEFETMRPHGQPKLYGWLMAEKFRRSIRGLESLLAGASVLTVCGGSGMDAEFLARRGAHVIASDLSLGAAQRAAERGRRLGLRIDAVVADVEHLPFADQSIDIVYVHDGLHHLNDPLVGLAEMCRVARHAVAISEPARAAVTAAAVRIGLSITEEDAGNRVERMSAQEIASCLTARGLRVIGADRYAMYYQHEPALAMRFFSRPRPFALARGSVSAFNGVLGIFGNKLSVRAIRDDPDDVERPYTATAPGPEVLRIIGLLDPEYGGTTEASVSETIAAQRSGIRNTFVFGIDRVSRVTTREAQERLRREGVIVLPFPVLPVASFYSRRWGLSVSLCVWILRNARRYEIIHLHQTWGLPQLAGLAAAVAWRRPCVVTPHECLTTYDVAREKRFVKQRLKNVFLRHAALTIFASDLEAADSVADRSRHKTQVLAHPNPDDDAIAASRAQRPDRVMRPFTVGFLGRLHPKKNIHLLIDAIAALDSAVHLRIAGDGPDEYRTALMAYTRDAGIADRVRWLGFVDRAKHDEFFSTIDVLALVSEYECFGVAASEAMAHAVPVLVSHRTGVAPIVEEYSCGLVVAADGSTIAAALQGLGGDRDQLAGMGSRGPMAVRERLSMQAYGSRLRRSYAELITPQHRCTIHR